MRVDYDKDQLAYALANALKERDEAREKAERYRIEANAMMMQRDEAREIAQQLIHIASHCLGWHENSNPETITDAINRWNASTKK